MKELFNKVNREIKELIADVYKLDPLDTTTINKYYYNEIESSLDELPEGYIMDEYIFVKLASKKAEGKT